MGRTSPIKDAGKLETFRKNLADAGLKYRVLFDLGAGTGLTADELLGMRVGDVRGKDCVDVLLGKDDVHWRFELSDELKGDLKKVVGSRGDREPLFVGRESDGTVLTREHASRTFRKAGVDAGIDGVGLQTARRTFAWRRYREDGDVSFVRKAFGHKSDAASFEFIDEEPDVRSMSNRISAERNGRIRKELLKGNSGRKRISKIVSRLESISESLTGENDDAGYFGRVGYALERIERILDGVE